MGVNVSEYVGLSLSLNDVTISLHDATSLEDVPSVSISVTGALSVAVYSEVSVSESVSVGLSDLNTSVHDLVTTEEDKTVELSGAALYPTVYDECSLSESASVSYHLSLSVYDEGSVSELVSGLGGDLLVSGVYDIVTSQEYDRLLAGELAAGRIHGLLLGVYRRD